MNTVTGDIGTPQSLGQLVGEEAIAELAVAVCIEELPTVAALAQVLVGHEGIKVDLAPAVGHGGQGHHTALRGLFQAVQQETGEQEVAQMVDPELDPKTVLSSPICH